jgi:hypothetical protein
VDGQRQGSRLFLARLTIALRSILGPRSLPGTQQRGQVPVRGPERAGTEDTGAPLVRMSPSPLLIAYVFASDWHVLFALEQRQNVEQLANLVRWANECLDAGVGRIRLHVN